ncbi:hypothetical protein [Fictibacillus terranigra]|uniref:hypothetical protein n=1 Tax=Fictibacillus terranigra TaxID=3058424 RepID=UPI0025B6D4CF|nr:hypothetical protein [Fictibacillus sp. CENA-BCM004]
MVSSFDSFDRYVLPHFPILIIGVSLVFVYAGFLYYRAKAPGMAFVFLILAVLGMVIANIYK